MNLSTLTDSLRHYQHNTTLTGSLRHGNKISEKVTASSVKGFTISVRMLTAVLKST